MKGNIGQLMKQAQMMQENMRRMQESLGAIEVEGQSGSGAVKVTMNCKHETRRVSIDPSYRQAILDGLQGAAGAPGGTSADVFAGFGRTIMGKTGTAERAGQEDQSWYFAYAPDQRRPLVVAVTVEQGGFGAESAAPAARLILSEWFGVEKKLVRGASATF